ncbi:hypothetical protein BP5796_05720 [Coleophoma crateriformis]|uniref:VOC domain-containing protein n=1 Tax=Coleophoma crateriformis TaxID=565419 RepID=A0A3D8RV61_9HELO|nr:hypothetical protein BP5796_05720 [Coleophoma crateriformis]
MATNFDLPRDKVMSPKSLAHVVLRTSNLEAMAKFYADFLGATIVFQNDYICFLAYDEEHHRIALIGASGTMPKVPGSCGLEHIAFTYSSIADLALAYRQRKSRGFLPIWRVNHGPTTSIYYSDLDGNQIETQVDNFDDMNDATIFMNSKLFDNNPIGYDFDPESLIERLQAGESEASIKKRIEVGSRGFNDLPMANLDFYKPAGQ